ncbi:MAG: exopolyphosphatase / guanosine-5-triphosphate,3-diphosphate pyrophosphatase [bacterium]|jgi:exopolyphosphatase/guanosine-5'-triphosphate,3'-diphosphate pyrophosphatase
MMATIRSACIDIGSNTTRLLVGERHDGGLREVLARRMFVPLVPGPGGAIAADTVGVLATVVAAHAATARECGADRVHAVATAAIRQAANRDALCEAVERESGIPVRVLAGADEARLAFAGATWKLDGPPDGLVGVADVGGGSSELVVGTAGGGIAWYASLAIGSGMLTARHVRRDPPTAAELAALRADADAAFGAVSAPRPAAAYAVGGSATSLRQLCGEELSVAALERGLARLAAWPVREAAGRLDLARERVRLLPAGLVLLRSASEAFGGLPLQVACGGLREGVLLEDFTRHASG